MLLRHRVVDRDELLVLHILNPDPMLLIRFLRNQRREYDPAAAHNRFAITVDYITANRADVEF